MKILLVITKAVVGGAQMSVLNLAREMKARGHEVFVGFGEGDFLPSELDKEKIPFFRFDFLKRTHNFFAPLFFALEVKKYANEYNFDVIHFNSSNALPGALGAKLANHKIKTVFTFRGMSMLDEHYEINKFFKFLYFIYFKFFLLFIDAPVFVSNDNFQKFGQGRLSKKGVMIHNGLDKENISFFDKIEARQFFSSKSGRDLSKAYVVGSLGRLDYAKNYEFLINIFPKILELRPESVAVIIGEGVKRVSYEKLIKEKGLEDKIFLIGNIDNGSRYLKGFDVLALSSRYEGLSIALIEALFASLPILASDVGGNLEIVAQEEQVFTLDDQLDFLKKFKAMQEAANLKKVLDNNMVQSANFLLSKTADGYEAVYKK